MTQLILVRHGETDWNRELRFQGQVDVPLNATGHEQARRVARRLAGEAVDVVVSSDLQRAQQTAAPLAALLAAQSRVPMQHSRLLREQNFGVVDGMRVDDIKTLHADAWDRWTQFQADYAFDGGESTRQFHARVVQGLAALVAEHTGKTLVVVTHGGVLDMVYRTARALSLDGPRQSDIPNGGLNHVRVMVDDATHRFDIVQWADIAHLTDMPPQPKYDQKRVAAKVRAELAD